MGITRRTAVWFSSPRQADLVEEFCPQPAQNELLVQTAVSAISAGTELLIYRGEAPADLSADEGIEALAGGLSFPIKYGYSAVGKVIGCGTAVSPDWLGRTVFAFNPHETHFVCQPDAVQHVPEGVPLELAALLPNMETAVSFLMDSRPMIGERVVVFGQGIVGLLTTMLLAKLPLAQLIVVDRLARRRDLALRLGASTAVSPDELAAVVPPTGFDLTLELSGSPLALQQAIGVTGDNGRLLIGSWYGNKSATLDLGGRFHRSQMQLISSQVSRLAPQHLGRWDKARRLRLAWRMLKQHQPDFLITHKVPFEEAPQAYRLLDEKTADVVQILLIYT